MPLTPRFTELFTRPEDTFPKTKGWGQGDVAENVRMLAAHIWEVGEQEDPWGPQEVGNRDRRIPKACRLAVWDPVSEGDIWHHPLASTQARAHSHKNINSLIHKYEPKKNKITPCVFFLKIYEYMELSINEVIPRREKPKHSLSEISQFSIP